jgi:hypothetical protein
VEAGTELLCLQRWVTKPTSDPIKIQSSPARCLQGDIWYQVSGQNFFTYLPLSIFTYSLQYPLSVNNPCNNKYHELLVDSAYYNSDK